MSSIIPFVLIISTVIIAFFDLVWLGLGLAAIIIIWYLGLMWRHRNIPIDPNDVY